MKKTGQSLALSEKVSSQNVAGNIYCDQPAEQMVRSSPSWRDNMLSAGKQGGVRSPLSVIGRRLTAGDLAAKKAARRGGGDIASAKKAVAELIAAVEMDSCKENVSPHLRKQPSSKSNTDEPVLITTDQPTSVNVVQAADLNKTQHVEAAAVLDVAASGIDEGAQMKNGTLVTEKDVHEDVSDGDDENKENVFGGWSPDEVAEISDSVDVERMVGDTVQQLDRQARTLRRRSQLSTDSDGYENVVRQLQLVRRRQAELERLQSTLRSRLLRCRPVSADDQPLNLKLSSARESERIDHDVAEPLDLRVPSVKQCREHNDTRVVLADITSKVVGDADPNDCFEVPDSPSPAAADAERSGRTEDAAEVMDGVIPICESFPTDHEGSAPVQTEKDFEESGRMKSTPVRLSPADCAVAGDKARTVAVLDQYLASLNVSDISDADTVVASPDTSSEFSNYRTYQRSLDVSGRCVDPVAAALFDGDEQVGCLRELPASLVISDKCLSFCDIHSFIVYCLSVCLSVLGARI